MADEWTDDILEEWQPEGDTSTVNTLTGDLRSPSIGIVFKPGCSMAMFAPAVQISGMIQARPDVAVNASLFSPALEISGLIRNGGSVSSSLSLSPPQIAGLLLQGNSISGDILASPPVLSCQAYAQNNLSGSLYAPSIRMDGEARSVNRYAGVDVLRFHSNRPLDVEIAGNLYGAATTVTGMT